MEWFTVCRRAAPKRGSMKSFCASKTTDSVRASARTYRAALCAAYRTPRKRGVYRVAKRHIDCRAAFFASGTKKARVPAGRGAIRLAVPPVFRRISRGGSLSPLTRAHGAATHRREKSRGFTAPCSEGKGRPHPARSFFQPRKLSLCTPIGTRRLHHSNVAGTMLSLTNPSPLLNYITAEKRCQ